MNIDNYADTWSDLVRKAVKNAFMAGFQYAQSLNLNDEEFVDLGLPSGTKWSKEYLGVTEVTKEGDYYTYADSQKYSIPTEIQFQELREHCSIIGDSTGYQVTGPNGKSVHFSCAGVQAMNDTITVSGSGMFWIRSEKPVVAFLSLVPCTSPVDASKSKYPIRLVKCNKVNFDI